MRNCLQSGEEETVVEALDVIQECCFLDQPLVNNHIQVPLMTSVFAFVSTRLVFAIMFSSSMYN